MIELLVTVVVVAIVATIAVPSLQRTIADNRLATQANRLLGALQLARSEAIKRNTYVTVCKKSANGASCDNSAVWQDGWIVFVDRNDNQSVDAGETKVGDQQPLAGGTAIASSGFSNYITYSPAGYSNTFGNFKLCPPAGSEWRQIKVASSGRARVITPRDGGSNPCP